MNYVCSDSGLCLIRFGNTLYIEYDVIKQALYISHSWIVSNLFLEYTCVKLVNLLSEQRPTAMSTKMLVPPITHLFLFQLSKHSCTRQPKI